MSKLLERFIHNALLEHVLEYGLKQFGFRLGSSTQEAILAATHDWHEALKRHNSVACVFFYLSKAFDSLQLVPELSKWSSAAGGPQRCQLSTSKVDFRVPTGIHSGASPVSALH